MVHNGIEYGLMQAYAEGFQILRGAPMTPPPDRAPAAETRRHRRTLAARQRCLVVAARSHRHRAGGDGHLNDFTGRVEDTGEGRWTIQTALEEGVIAEVLAAALYARFRSRHEHTFADKVMSAMRKGFGGHVEEPPALKVKKGL